MYLSEIQLAFLEMAMDYLEDVDDLGHSTEARAREIKAEAKAELDSRSLTQQD